MTREDAMQEVELDAAGDEGWSAPGDAPAEAARRRRRRTLLRWWPLAVVAAAAVGAGQLVAGARERERVVSARGVDGVVDHDLVPPLAVEPLAGTEDAPAARTGILAGDLRVDAERPVLGEPRAVVAVVAADGRRAWRTEVEPAARAEAQPSMQTPACSAVDEPTTRVICLVEDSPTTPEADGAWSAGPPTRTRMLTLDAATGAVLAERELAPMASAVVDGDSLLLAQVDDQDVLRVTREDAEAVTGSVGAPSWSTVLANGPLDGGGWGTPGIWVDRGHLVVGSAVASWVLDPDDGTVVTAGSRVWVGRTGALLSWSGDDAVVRLLASDGTGGARVSGTPVWLAVDDGSAPGLELLSRVVDGGRRLSAVVAVTGEVVWERASDDDTDGALILLGGVLYGADGTTVWAVDAADGRQIWRTPREPDADGTPLTDLTGDWLRTLTDGRRLLLQQTTADGPVLVAWSLASGERLWAEPMPAEVGPFLQVVDGALVGGTETPLRIGG
ncbi:PQQ-binding-like beta-propeller repeat protein [Cellulomonas sp. ACRRI]|uniref:outer membrane protein assembly factor BamB family protein n=1 Tax=Cellulomonas sp. ACRRI TaxID=2918188 RepID=UPI001EF34570|nr:PQQ-binding-like beta-propeller repeat protein [Cellulomonas sp. ACRRI]MCG7287696.1 PQQ-binding-like beta-propeller repeat protein [Cellulomonas sp. ACRRI]